MASTQRAYLQVVTKVARHSNQSLDRISNDELKAYLLHLHQEEQRATEDGSIAHKWAAGVSPATILTWTDPSGMTTPYALAVDAHNDSVGQEVLGIPAIGLLDIPITATSWQPPMALPNGLV